MSLKVIETYSKANRGEGLYDDLNPQIYLCIDSNTIVDKQVPPKNYIIFRHAKNFKKIFFSHK